MVSMRNICQFITERSRGKMQIAVAGCRSKLDLQLGQKSTPGTDPDLQLGQKSTPGTHTDGLLATGSSIASETKRIYVLLRKFFTINKMNRNLIFSIV